jgi:hypothetical protein
MRATQVSRDCIGAFGEKRDRIQNANGNARDSALQSKQARATVGKIVIRAANDRADDRKCQTAERNGEGANQVTRRGEPRGSEYRPRCNAFRTAHALLSREIRWPNTPRPRVSNQYSR